MLLSASPLAVALSPATCTLRVVGAASASAVRAIAAALSDDFDLDYKCEAALMRAHHEQNLPEHLYSYCPQSLPTSALKDVPLLSCRPPALVFCVASIRLKNAM